jgi:dihydroorotate dehydrogenase
MSSWEKIRGEPEIIPMSLIPYALTRPFLFGLDPEAAHDLTMDMHRWRGQGTPLQWAWCNEPVDDPIELAGLRFPNRVGLAAGLDKNARCIDGLGAMGFGFVEVGTVTPKGSPATPSRACSACPRPRTDQPPGLQQRRAGRLCANVQRSAASAAQKHAMLLGLNIGKNAATPIEDATSDYLTCLDGVYPHADYVTVNISSPNTKNLRALQSDEALDGLLGAIAERREQLASSTQPTASGACRCS